MKQLFYITTIIFLGIIALSWTNMSPNVDYWQLTYNDKIIFSGHSPQPDTIVTLDIKKFKNTDSIKYFYHPCSFDDRISYSTKLYLVTPQQTKTLIANQKSNGYKFGNFSVMTIQKIVDSCNCNTFQLEEITVASWINDKGKTKSDNPFPRTMLSIVVIK
jgi:hypothetical protein